MYLQSLLVGERLRDGAHLAGRCRRDIAQALPDLRLNAYLPPNPPRAIADAPPDIRYIWLPMLQRGRPGCCSVSMLLRPPSTDLSIGGGLVASAQLGVPSGHPERGLEGVPPPLCLEPSPYLPFPTVSDPRVASRLRVFRCTRARVGGRSRCWRVRVPRQHAWGA